MSSTHRNSDQWLPCPKGAIEELSVNLSQQLQRQQMLRRRKFIAGSLTGAVAVTGSGFLILGLVRQQSDPGGISCAQVEKNIIAFNNGSLDRELAQKIKAHLRKCEPCQAQMQEMA